MIPLPDETWPLLAPAAAPYAGDELAPGSPPATSAQAALVALHGSVLLGACPPTHPSLATAAAAAGVVEPRPPSERQSVQPLPVAPLLPCDAWLADVSENVAPDMGLSSPGRVLGPWADEAPSRRTLRVAAGVMAFAPYIAPRVRPFDRWTKDRRGGTPEERDALRAVDRAPAMCWSVDTPGRPVPMLPMAARLLPDGPVRLLPDRAGSPPTPLPVGTWLARVMRAPGGWYAALALPLAARPDPDWLLARMELELWHLRCFVPTADWILLLRERAEVLYRSCHEWAWTVPEAMS